MISVIIHWDHKQAMDPKNMRYIFQLWDYVARSFGVPKEYTIYVDCEGSLRALSPPNPVVDTLEDALSIAKELGHTPVYVHNSGNAVLPKFIHPENACYIIGPNYAKLEIPVDAEIVRIPLFAEPNDLFAQTVLPIILYDRTRG